MTPHVLGEIRRALGSFLSAARKGTAVKTFNMGPNTPDSGFGLDTTSLCAA
jgi:hypothetical protein